MLNRPQITDERLKDIIAASPFSYPGGYVSLVGLRGYFANSVGIKGANDVNVYDDAMLVLENQQIVGRYNANTDPSKQEGRAHLLPGIYTFYRGRHKNRIDAFRAYPEGVVWKCERMQNGVMIPSTCSYINIHDGGITNTWSEGCQTLPGAKAASVWENQFAEMRDLVYKLMRQHSQLVVGYLLLDVTGKI